MKKTRLLLLLAAVLAVTAFTACNSESEEIVSPVSENQLGEPIKAQFTISIPMDTKGMTRQSAGIVQNSENYADFRGINDIKLFPSAVKTDLDVPANDAFKSTSTIGTPIVLNQLLKPVAQTVNHYIPNGKLLQTSNTVLYGDVSLAEGLQTFLFYGKAIGKSEGENVLSYTPAERFKYGMLVVSGMENASDVSGFKFAPWPIVESVSNSNTLRNNIVTYLNSIATAATTETVTETEGTPPTTVAVTKWSETTNQTLSSLYTSFIGMKAGSSNHLQAAIEDLYNALKDNAHPIAIAVCDAINNSTYVTLSDGTGDEAGIKKVTFTDKIAGYPSASDNLPDGAAVLGTYTQAAGFNFAETAFNSTTMNVANIGSYAYPANLYYFVRSPILTSNSSKASLYTDAATLATIKGGYTDGTIITKNTRSVFLTAPVQYGVARLDITVSGAAATIPDGGTGTNAHDVNLSDLKLTGILVAGQKNVGWNFQPISGTEYTVFDNIVSSQEQADGIAISTDGTTVKNHTLLLETPEDADAVVNVALEFINNGPDFWGQGGIVPKGCKFYLVGQLKMSEADADQKAIAGNKIFRQDYKTIAKFKINNLSKAECTIPDLRNPLIELGLSVNLHWEAGNIYDITFQ